MALYQALYNRQPWGEFRADVAAAMIAQTSVMPHLKPSATPPPLEDFMPFAEKRQPTDAELIAKLELIVGGMNAARRERGN